MIPMNVNIREEKCTYTGANGTVNATLIIREFFQYDEVNSIKHTGHFDLYLVFENGNQSNTVHFDSKLDAESAAIIYLTAESEFRIRSAGAK